MAEHGAGAAPKLAAPDVSTGRIEVRGAYAPASHGPVALAGRYRASFAQHGSGVDWGSEVPFTAHLETTAVPPRRVDLFQDAAEHGSTTITVRPGRYRVVVDFGDSPYDVVLTKRGASR
jgi:hypothetical protein